MAEGAGQQQQISELEIGQFQTLSSLIASDTALQIAIVVLSVGLVGIFSVYFKFSKWIQRQKFSYTKPQISRFVRKGVLPFFAIALVSGTNAYVQIFELFGDDGAVTGAQPPGERLSPQETFAKILNTMNVIVIGYTVSQIVPILLAKHEETVEVRGDFEAWKEKGGFSDDPCYNCEKCKGKRYGACDNAPALFAKLFKWVPPKQTPYDFTDEEFQEYLKTEQGRNYLERYRTSSGQGIGSYVSVVKDPFKEWKKAEREKFERYMRFCLSGNNAAGRELTLGAKPKEVYTIDDWREERRESGYEYVTPGDKPPGYIEQKQKSRPPDIKRIIPVAGFLATIVGVAVWWGVDLVVLATATGGIGLGVGLALRETMENYFAYILIRKDKIFQEGDRIQLEGGYNGYVHRITARVTYIRHPLNESLAIVPTRQLVNAQILNYTKEIAVVPALVEVGVSYLNDPKQVAAILIMVGKRVMEESVDSKGKHMVKQSRCPYLDQNKPSCGCDEKVLVDIEQPKVRFNSFNDSALDFIIWLYARDYGSQFKIETDLRMAIYEEFQKHDIRIPWPIRTIYQGDDKKETDEISKLNKQRDEILRKYGIGDIAHRYDDGD